MIDDIAAEQGNLSTTPSMPVFPEGVGEVGCKPSRTTSHRRWASSMQMMEAMAELQQEMMATEAEHAKAREDFEEK